jgi:hypothetical protein
MSGIHTLLCRSERRLSGKEPTAIAGPRGMVFAQASKFPILSIGPVGDDPVMTRPILPAAARAPALLNKIGFIEEIGASDRI